MFDEEKEGETSVSTFLSPFLPPPPFLLAISSQGKRKETKKRCRSKENDKA